MKTQMHQNSLIAFSSLLADNNMSIREKEVFLSLYHLGKATSKEVAKNLDWTINRVTGRINGLLKKGYIYSRANARTGVRQEMILEITQKGSDYLNVFNG